MRDLYKALQWVTLRLERGIGLCIAIVEVIMYVFPYFEIVTCFIGMEGLLKFTSFVFAFSLCSFFVSAYCYVMTFIAFPFPMN
jgi:hypothetical protein